jgi:hypothetical protein
LVWATSAGAAVRYVNVSSASPSPPYTNWTTAATVIQDAVDVALAGDEILVTNGVYQTGGLAVYGAMTNRVAVTKPLTLRSVNGPEVTVIRGYQVPGTTNGNGAARCVYLATGATLVGFTLTNGATRGEWEGLEQSSLLLGGGGVWCQSPSAVLSNCVLSGNSAFLGGGAFGSTLHNCTLTGNSARSGGGANGATLDNCTLQGNSASELGGGTADSTLTNCTLIGNSALVGGGSSYSALHNCTLSGNSAGHEGGGTHSCVVNNCLLTRNRATDGGGAYSGTLNNCTLFGNWATERGGGVGAYFYSGGAPGCADLGCTMDPAILNNCIVYYNSAPGGPNANGDVVLYYSCTTALGPLIPHWDGVALQPGPGNFTNAPLFINEAAGNFRLQPNSPCINAGRNAYAPAGPDLDRNPRIMGGSVDVGAYEFQSPLSAISYAWLQQYGLPTDGSADLADPDGDGLNNWQEWRAWTDAKNPGSALRLLTPSFSANGLVVRWQSVNGQTYFLERGKNLGAQSAFTPLASDLVGQAGTTLYIDTNAVGAGPFFYRVGVQE